MSSIQSFLYVFGAEGTALKVGYSNNPKLRAVAYRTDAIAVALGAHRGTVLHTVLIPCAFNPRDAEKAAHAILDKFRIETPDKPSLCRRGPIRCEWFATDRTSASAAIERAVGATTDRAAVVDRAEPLAPSNSILVPLVLTPEEAGELDDWRFQHRCRFRTTAVKSLMRLGYEATAAHKESVPLRA